MGTCMNAKHRVLMTPGHLKVLISLHVHVILPKNSNAGTTLNTTSLLCLLCSCPSF